MTNVSIDAQISCVRRELAMRQRAYPKWVAGGRMKQPEADKELAAMQAVHDTLMAVMAQTRAVAAMKKGVEI